MNKIQFIQSAIISVVFAVIYFSYWKFSSQGKTDVELAYWSIGVYAVPALVVILFFIDQKIQQYEKTKFYRLIVFVIFSTMSIAAYPLLIVAIAILRTVFM